MANERRRLFPDMATRFTPSVGGLGVAITSLATTTYKIYTDSAATTLANITDTSYVAINQTTSPLALDSTSMLPEFYGPDDGTDTLYARKADGTGPIWPLQANNDARLDDMGAWFTSVTDPQHGAVAGTGTDQTAAFDRAVAAAASGARVFIPSGRYIVDLFTINKDIVLCGVGPGVILQSPNSATNHMMRIGSTTRLSRVVLEGITFDANSANRTAGTYDTVYLGATGNTFGSALTVIRDCDFVNPVHMHLETDGAATSVVHVQTCTFDGDPLTVNGAAIYNADKTHLYIDRCTFSGLQSAHQCVYNEYGYLQFTGNTIEDCYAGPDIRSTAQAGCVISGNTFISGANSTGNDVSTQAERTIITHNKFLNTTTRSTNSAVVVLQGAHHVFEANVMTSSVSAWLVRVLTAGSRTRILDNYFSGSGLSSNTNSAIYIDSSATVAVLARNNVFNAFLYPAQVHGGGSGVLYYVGNTVTSPVNSAVEFRDNNGGGTITPPHAALVLGDYVNTAIASSAMHEFAGQVYASAQGITTKTKAGIPTDADTNIDADGTIIVDTTNHRLYVRSGGAWKYAALT